MTAEGKIFDFSLTMHAGEQAFQLRLFSKGQELDLLCRYNPVEALKELLTYSYSGNKIYDRFFFHFFPRGILVYDEAVYKSLKPFENELIPIVDKLLEHSYYPLRRLGLLYFFILEIHIYVRC